MESYERVRKIHTSISPVHKEKLNYEVLDPPFPGRYSQGTHQTKPICAQVHGFQGGGIGVLDLSLTQCYYMEDLLTPCNSKQVKKNKMYWKKL